MMHCFGLSRFAVAQEAGGSYANALLELSTTGKVTCWMWYVFPMLRGIGTSAMSVFYGLDGMGEARRYLKSRKLGERLRRAAEIVESRKAHGILRLMGSPVDVRKFHACMTLFDAVAPGEVFGRCLTKFFGGRRDLATVRMLDRGVGKVADGALTGGCRTRYNGVVRGYKGPRRKRKGGH